MTTIESVTACVRHLFERYARAIVSGDETLWSSLWDERAVQLLPGEAVIFGRRAIAQRFRERCSDSVTEFTVSTEEVHVAGDLAFARGTMLSALLARSDGAREFGDSKFLTIFRRHSNGEWRIFRECCNDNPRARPDRTGV